MFVYINGEYMRQEEAAISPFDHGFLYGLGVFETLRTYEGHPFLLDDHLARLNAGLEQLNIPKRFTRDEVVPIISHLSELNGLKDSYIRFNVSAGNGEIGLQTEPYEQPTVIMFQKSLPPLVPLREKEAVLLRIRRNTPETGMRIKSHHFLNNVAAKRELGPDPAKEGIFLSEQGHLAEGVTSNLFWVKEGVLFTPELSTGILNGITRQFIFILANQLEIRTEEGLYGKDTLTSGDEIFFTNSIQEIVPVHRMEGRNYPGKSGAIVNRLHEAYQQSVNVIWSKNE